MLGATDMLLTESLDEPARHAALARCLERAGIDALIRSIEDEVIPQPNFGGVPMPVVVRHALEQLCAAG